MCQPGRPRPIDASHAGSVSRGGLFPERKVARVFFFVLVGVDAFTGAGDVSREVDLRELAVLRKRSDAVVDRIVGSIGVIGGQQFLDQRHHLRNVTRCARNDFGPFAAERVEVFPERVDVVRGVVVDAQAGLLRLGDDAVVHVSDIHHVRDFVAFELQVTTQDVGGDGAAEVSDVAVIPDGWTAVIEADFALVAAGEILRRGRIECSET